MDPIAEWSKKNSENVVYIIRKTRKCIFARGASTSIN